MQGKNIYLIGFMGSGKSAVSSGLSADYGFTVIEMDQEIVDREGMPISEIFAKKGEEYFRQVETSLLREISEKSGVVVSCGGGVATRDENIALMKSSGRVILLKASPETIYKRVKNSNDRPLLRGHMNVPYIADMMEKRRPMYEKAADETVMVDNRSLKEICLEIMSK